MESDVIVAAVLKMRKLQKEYFRTKNALVLAECKKTEKEVDRMLEDYLQPSIFDNK